MFEIEVFQCNVARIIYNMNDPSTHPGSSVVSKSTIVIFIVVIAILCLLLCFAESNDRQRAGDLGAAAFAYDKSCSTAETEFG